MRIVEDEDSIIYQGESTEFQSTDEEIIEFEKLPTHNSTHVKALKISLRSTAD